MSSFLKSRIKPWNHPFFRTSSDSLENEVKRILENKNMFPYLDASLDSQHGLRLGTLNFKEAGFKVNVHYGIRPYGGVAAIYLMKDNPVNTPFDFTIVTSTSFNDVADTFLPPYALPAPTQFVSDINNTLKRPTKYVEYVVPTRLL